MHVEFEAKNKTLCGPLLRDEWTKLRSSADKWNGRAQNYQTKVWKKTQVWENEKERKGRIEIKQPLLLSGEYI